MPRKPKIMYNFKYYLDNVTKLYNIYDSDYDIYWTGFKSIDEIEEAMQTVMDKYAGGISCNYEFNEDKLNIAERKIGELEVLAEDLKAEDMDELIKIYEIKERLVVAKVLIAHLRARKETRWHSFCENTDYRYKDNKYLKYVNSRVIDNKIKIIFRDIVQRGKIYEHQD